MPLEVRSLADVLAGVPSGIPAPVASKAAPAATPKPVPVMPIKTAPVPAITFAWEQKYAHSGTNDVPEVEVTDVLPLDLINRFPTIIDEMFPLYKAMSRHQKFSMLVTGHLYIALWLVRNFTYTATPGMIRFSRGLESYQIMLRDNKPQIMGQSDYGTFLAELIYRYREAGACFPVPRAALFGLDEAMETL